MSHARHRLLPLLLIAAGSLAIAASQQTAKPAEDAADKTAVLGTTTFVNHGLAGVGRLSASRLDAFGETLGSVSGLQISNWTRRADGTYSGTAHMLPDRGYNGGGFYADYAARINEVGFVFTPSQQIAFDTRVTGVQFRYDDPVTHRESHTTGLDPGATVGTLFGRKVPYVTTYTGPRQPGAATASTFPGINKLAIDAEALALRPDGSGYLSDEYGPYIYAFDRTKKITGIIAPPAALLPHKPAGVLNFTSAAPPIDGRRNNQGFEGLALSPDGSRLFALLQSAAVQDANPAVNDQLARHTRLLVYDVRATATPPAPIAEYALTLPAYKSDGSAAPADRTAAQSEIVALDADRLLVLARDANGLGSVTRNPSVFKRVLLVDLRIGAPTNFASDAARNAAGGRITTAPGVLDPAITPLRSVDVVDLLDAVQLQRFNLTLDNGRPVSKLTLSEKWEGMALLPAFDRARPDDYFLFVANDNDFLTSDGRMAGPDGTKVRYDGFAGYPPERVPPAVDTPNHENDTLFMVFRVTIRSGQASNAQ